MAASAQIHNNHGLRVVGVVFFRFGISAANAGCWHQSSLLLGSPSRPTGILTSFNVLRVICEPNIVHLPPVLVIFPAAVDTPALARSPLELLAFAAKHGCEFVFVHNADYSTFPRDNTYEKFGNKKSVRPKRPRSLVSTPKTTNRLRLAWPPTLDLAVLVPPDHLAARAGRR